MLVAQVLGLDLSDKLRGRVVHAAAALSEPGVETAETVEDLYLQSVALAQGCGDHLTVAASAIGSGLIALERGDPDTAEPRLRSGLSASERAGEPGQWTSALAHSWLATAYRFQGNAPSAVRHATEAAALTRQRGDSLSECIALYNLAHAELMLTHHDQARTHLVDAVLSCQLTRDAGNLSFVLDALAAVEFATGARERVATLLGAAETLRASVRSAVYRWYAPDVALRRRTSEAVRAQLGAEAYARAVDAGRTFTFEGAAEFARRSIPSGA